MARYSWLQSAVTPQVSNAAIVTLCHHDIRSLVFPLSTLFFLLFLATDSLIVLAARKC